MPSASELMMEHLLKTRPTKKKTETACDSTAPEADQRAPQRFPMSWVRVTRQGGANRTTNSMMAAQGAQRLPLAVVRS